MFSKSKKNNDQQQVSTPRTVPSIISADLHIVGDLESAGEVQIDGEVSGDIRARVLLVGESAVVKGEIFADTVRVHGHINGQIKAKFVNLAKTAHVIGDILHENLSIQEGAFLEGHITHMSEADVRAMDEANGRPTEPQSEQTQSGVAKAGAAKTVETRPVETKPGEASPGEDRVNLVVKSGTQAGTQAAKTTPAVGPGTPGTPKAASGS